MAAERSGIFANFSRVFATGPLNLRSRIIAIYALLIPFNLVVWAIAIGSFAGSYPALLGTALLAYSFGLRHAVDADHISAIDNVTRKLMQERKRPVAVGLFFSLGHSTIVVGLSIAIAIAESFVQKNIPALQNAGGLIGTSISALFLMLIAVINMLVLWDIFKAFQKVKRGEEYNEQSLDEFLNQRGLMGRFFRPLLRIVNNSWNMYPIGVLFGLGFDTATEVGILAIAATAASKGLPTGDILIFPALFMAGMTLVDTTDGILMLGAYGWAFLKPVRKLYYNLNITLISVLVALVIGGIEALSVVATQLRLSGGFWDLFNNLDLNMLGFFIIGIFILSWLISALIYKVRRYDQLDVKMAQASTDVAKLEAESVEAGR